MPRNTRGPTQATSHRPMGGSVGIGGFLAGASGSCSSGTVSLSMDGVLPGIPYHQAMAISQSLPAFASINPATEEEVEKFAPHSDHEVENRLARSRSAYGEWSRWDLDRRLALI